MNTQININVQGEIRIPDLALLAQAITGKAATAPTETVKPVFHVQVPVAPAPASALTPAIPSPAPTSAVPSPASAPVAPAPASAPVAPAPVIPTSTPTYSIDDVARAGATLAQQGPDKINALTGLLQQFGLQAVTQLRPEQMGPFVTALRGLGAQI